MIIAVLLLAGCSRGGEGEALEPTSVSTTAVTSVSTTAVTDMQPPPSIDCSTDLVTEADAGDEVNVGRPTQRFSICLDATRHPLRQLERAGCPFGYVSNLSANGPGSYPIGFQVTAAGSCVVRNGDFQVRIVATE